MKLFLAARCALWAPRGALWSLRLLISAGVVAAAQPAPAAQLLDLRDGDTTVTRVSVRDQTRLRVERGRVIDVIGDVFDADKNPAGRVVVLKDDAEGEVYVKPMLPASVRAADGSLPAGPLVSALQLAPVKLDIKTDRGTVGLVLQAADVIGDTITLRISGLEGRALPVEPIAKTAAHVRAAKALTLAMASPGMAGEVPVQRLPGQGQEVALWKEARFVLVARYEVPGLVGEVYELTNVSGEAMVIDERELYRPGVVSVSLRELKLKPAATTKVWIVRQTESQD